MTERVAWKIEVFGLVGVALLSACAAKAAPLAAAPAIAAPPTTPANATQPPPASGWPSAQDATTPPGRDSASVPAGGACVNPVALASGAPQPDLELRLSGPKRVAKGEHPQLSAQLKNVSRSRAHHIVLPSDGSDAGWRDPVISFTAFIDDDGDGCWTPLERAPVMRCGLFDVSWEDDVVRLTAGSKRVIDPLWGFPSFQWRKGTVRLFLHYAWTGGAASKGATQSVDPSSLGAMAREKPYELVSNPIEFEVTA